MKIYDRGFCDPALKYLHEGETDESLAYCKNINEVLPELFDMQTEYDQLIFGKFGRPSLYQMQMATLDELGEVCHALKGDWCWWKQTQKPVDKQEVLEELADVLHFSLSLCEQIMTREAFAQVDFGSRVSKPIIFEAIGDIVMMLECMSYECDDLESLEISASDNVSTLQYEATEILVLVISLAWGLGYSFPDLAEAYRIKNRENFSRQERGY